jgi:hypothetical protein
MVKKTNRTKELEQQIKRLDSSIELKRAIIKDQKELRVRSADAIEEAKAMSLKLKEDVASDHSSLKSSKSSQGEIAEQINMHASSISRIDKSIALREAIITDQENLKQRCIDELNSILAAEQK